MVLFGGFYEQKRDMHWFNDTYIFSFQEERWHAVTHKPLSHVPRVRSGHQLVLHAAEDCLYLYGGFSKEKQAVQDASRKEACVHDDVWRLSLRPVLGLDAGGDDETVDGDTSSSKKKRAVAVGGGAAFDASKASWSKVSKKGAKPSARSGAVVTVYKSSKAILFGGVYDVDLGHGLKSAFHNDLYTFDMLSSRWYELEPNGRARAAPTNVFTLDSVELTEPKGASAVKVADDLSNTTDLDPEDGAKEGVPASVLVRLEAASVENAELSLKITEAGAIGRHFKRYYSTQPCPRINPSIFLKGNKFYVYGGVTELDEVEVTLDDCWKFDLNKRDRWVQVLEGTMSNFVWKGQLDNATEGTCSDDEGEQEALAGAGAGDSDSDVDVGTRDEKGADGPTPGPALPRVGETLRDFYNRTADYWMDLSANSAPQILEGASEKELKARGKQIKRAAFSLAEEVFISNT